DQLYRLLCRPAAAWLGAAHRVRAAHRTRRPLSQHGEWRGTMTLMGRERGQAVVWVAAMLPFFLAILGLAIDGGVVWDAERQLQATADGAARAGAEAVDTSAYYASNG